jgi:Protein of unknown function, DUF481
MDRTRARIAWSLSALLILAPPATAQESASPPPKKKPWTNDTELSVVATQGNSDTLTVGLKNRYETPTGKLDKGNVRFKVEATLSSKADDRFVIASAVPGQPVDPLDPCGSPGASCVTVEPSPDDSIERYLFEGHYDRKLRERAVWNAGASWDRNLTDGSGVESRMIGFAGLGHVWWDREDLKFSTNYSLSYTDRRETTPDPEKNDQFTGVRFDWSYKNDWTKSKTVTYTNTWTINASLRDSSDFGFDMTNGIGVSMTERVALQVSLQWLYNNFPPLETVDLDCANPDPSDPRTTVPCNLLCVDASGILTPCTAPGAIQLNDETDIRKEKSDLIFNTSLVIKL